MKTALVSHIKKEVIRYLEEKESRSLQDPGMRSTALKRMLWQNRGSIPMRTSRTT